MNWHVTQVTGNESIGKHTVRYVVTWSGASGKWNAKATRNDPNPQIAVLLGNASTTISRDRCVELIRAHAASKLAKCTCEWCE